MRRHELDPVSLVVGLVCAGIAMAVLLGAAGLGTAQRWVAPVLLLILGVGGLTRYARRGPHG
ncbi:MAG: hypothetical protein M3P23_10135 [Actinomycetota bacterium]|nr:hypothetical protein [Actinomycetota bacterium]